MLTERCIRLMLFAPVVALLSLSACGGGSSSNPGCVGKERCACYANMTCNTGLMCLSDICVSLTGTAGTNGAGGLSTGVGGGPPNTGLGGGPGPGLGGGTAVGTGGAGGAITGGGGGSATCDQGLLQCPCYPNQTCNAGLMCTSGTCVVSTGMGGGSGTMPGPNLIKNGDFTRQDEYWKLTFQMGDIGAQSYSGGQFCVQNASSLEWLSFTLGYPPTPSDAFAMDAKASYTLSFRAYSSYGSMAPAIMVKIGQVETPYAELYSTTDYVTGASFASFTHRFTPSASDSTAGLALNGTVYDYADTVCFDDVTLVKN